MVELSEADLEEIEDLLLHIVYPDAYTDKDTKDDQRIAFDLIEKLEGR